MTYVVHPVQRRLSQRSCYHWFHARTGHHQTAEWLSIWAWNHWYSHSSISRAGGPCATYRIAWLIESPALVRDAVVRWCTTCAMLTNMWCTIVYDAGPFCDWISRALWQHNHRTVLYRHVTGSWPKMRDLQRLRDLQGAQLIEEWLYHLLWLNILLTVCVHAVSWIIEHFTFPGGWGGNSVLT